MLHNLSRRSLFIGAASIIAAPAVIRVAQLMPIKPWLSTDNMTVLYNQFLSSQMYQVDWHAMTHALQVEEWMEGRKFFSLALAQATPAAS